MKICWTEYLNDAELVKKFRTMVAEGMGRMVIERELGVPRRAVQALIKYFREQDPGATTTYDLMRARQKYADKATVLRRVVTSGVRLSNATDELVESLDRTISKYRFAPPAKAVKATRSDERWDSRHPVGILQCADLHLNETVLAIDTAGYNSADYGKACARLKKFVLDAGTFFDAANCRKILVVNTGDAVNSDRRLDEILTNAGNRSRALIVAVDIIQQVLMELSRKYQVVYITVGGNESRQHQDITYNERTFSNNHDNTIHHILSRLCQGTGIDFRPIQGTVEQLVSINRNQTILFVHGHQFKGSDIETSVTRLFSKYSKSRINLQYVVAGHLHATYNSDFFSRSASLVGDNAYSSGCLIQRSKAAQNIYIVTDDGIIPISIDLQNTLKSDGAYSYDKDFAYGTEQMKSRQKADNRLLSSTIVL